MSELSFDSVTVRYGAGRHALTAVDDVTLTVPAGQVVGLVGESGSGKTTLGWTAVGLAPMSSGRVLVDGEDLRSGGRRAPDLVQVVFQDPYSSLDPRMSIGASIAEALPRRLRGNRATARAEVARLLALVNLDPDRAGTVPGLLSGGQRQRVALARALAARPKAIIADEITSALDVSVQGAVLNLVRDLQRQLQLSTLLISHNLAVIRYTSDIVAVMYLGRIVEVGPVDQVLSDPRHPYTQELLSAVPRRGTSLLDIPSGDPQLRAVSDAEPGDPHNRPAGCAFHPRCPVGPMVLRERRICVEVDPQEAAAQRPHRTACHFAAEAVAAAKA